QTSRSRPAHQAPPPAPAPPQSHHREDASFFRTLGAMGEGKQKNFLACQAWAALANPGGPPPSFHPIVDVDQAPTENRRMGGSRGFMVLKRGAGHLSSGELVSRW